MMNRYINIFRYLTALGAVLFGAIAVFGKESELMYLGIMLLMLSLNVFAHAINLRGKRENKAKEITSYVVGSIVFFVSVFLILRNW
ncbi:hypothetical protein [Paenibacillus thiaminolyticus]|uniref:Uncharacterized protein n=1 Tax=Paenibacillus thiaminolyticus TaxID=49283 RepID=A0A3A3GNN8_PANTH|nr:hypothetical protein [Paenibacillus thiaminolyticus]RJG25586.1 hypothetical protein DQX05_05725 [Paenibacillus thiaminolyticus]